MSDDKVTGIVSVDGKQLGVMIECKTDTRTNVLTLKVQQVPEDVQLITPKQAFDKGLINEADYRKMEEERNKVQKAQIEKSKKNLEFGQEEEKE